MIVPWVARLAILMVIAGTAATVAGLGARAHWLLELAVHFPVHYLGVLVTASGLCFALGRRRWALLGALAAMPNLLAIAPYLPGLVNPPALTTTAQPPVRLIAANLRYNQEDATGALAYFTRESPDVLVLMEVTPRWQQKLAGLERAYPHFAVRTRWNPWGIAVYSRYPFSTVEDLDLGDDRSANLRVILQLPGGPAELYAVHLASPPSRVQSAMRNLQLRRLADRIAAADPELPRLVAGDLNITPWSPWFRDFLREARLGDARRPFGLHVTWPTFLAPFGIAIDHCLAGHGLRVYRVAAGPETGSDHFPLECSFGLAP